VTTPVPPTVYENTTNITDQGVTQSVTYTYSIGNGVANVTADFENGTILFNEFQIGLILFNSSLYNPTHSDSSNTSPVGNKVTSWWKNDSSQVQVVFHPSTHDISASGKEYEYNITLLLHYASDWRNITPNFDIPPGPPTVVPENPGPEGLKIVVVVEGTSVATYIVRLGWRVKNTTLDKSFGSDGYAPAPPPPYFENYTWKGIASVYFETNPAAQVNPGFRPAPFATWVCLAVVALFAFLQ